MLNLHGMLNAPPVADSAPAQTGIAECAAYLRQFNCWRRGDDDTLVGGPNPRELGLHIDEARADGHDYKPLGADCDRFQWERVLHHFCDAT